jgi:hypothetical protein
MLLYRGPRLSSARATALDAAVFRFTHARLPSQIATTDAGGRARTQSLPAGRYWVLSDAMVGGKRMMWHELVEVRSGDQLLTLDQRNARPVD